MRLRKSNIEQYDEEKYLTHRKEVLDKTMKGMEVYTVFNPEQVRCGAQYRHLEQQRERMKKR